MRIRSSDVLTNTDYKIGVCRQCGRYGQLDKERLVCSVVDPASIFNMEPAEESEWFRRVRYCQRVKDKHDRRTA